MLKGRVIKLDPTPRQQQQILSHIGGARFAYNAMLAWSEDQYKQGSKPNLSGYGLRKVWNAHKHQWAPWWADNSKECYANACINLADAYKRFFRELKQGKRAGRPRFKKKNDRGSYTITTGSFGICDPHGVKIPRIGRVHTLEPLTQIDPKSVKSMTIRQKADGFYVSLCLDEPHTPSKRKEKQSVGVDVGIKQFATLSTGEVVENPRLTKKHERKTKRLHRNLSRKKRGSDNRRKAKAKLARWEKKIADKRADFLHKTTSDLVRRFNAICIEDLNVQGMLRNHHLAKSVQDVSLYEFRRQLEYKCEREQIHLTISDRWFPSTKTCSRCGNVQDIPLSIRTYTCDNCGLTLDRDVNAAINLNKLNTVAGSAPETQNACGEPVRPIIRQGSMKQESRSAYSG